MLRLMWAGIALCAASVVTLSAAAQQGDSKPSPYLDNGLIYPEEFTAKLSVVVDRGQSRIYVRLVLQNTSEEPVTIPIYLEKYPYFESATLLLKHKITGEEVYYPGPISVTWSRPGPEIPPGEKWDTTFSLTRAWFTEEGDWTAVWRRAVTRPEGNQLVIDRWENASEVVDFEIPPGFISGR